MTMATTHTTHDSVLRDAGIESHWLKPYTAARRMLIVYAHPDDESFGNAGTILRYTHEGVAVHYACATRGEAGTVKPSFLENYAEIAALRTAELMCAADVLGLSSVHLLGYRDSGMTGMPENDDPRSLHQAPLRRVTRQVVALIRALRPQVVVTFNPYGGYGHPDHIKVHKATIAAFPAAGDPLWFREQIEAGLGAWNPAKLYYGTFSTTFLQIIIPVMRLRGEDPRRSGENADIDLVRALAETTPVTTRIDTRRYFEQREQAWQCHASQGSGVRLAQWLPVALRRRVFGPAEGYTRVVPAWNGRRRKEEDLFAGV